MPSAERLICAERAGIFFSAPRVEEWPTLDKTLCSSLSLSSQPTNQSGGGAGLPTVLRLNNNGEVNIACLRVFIFFTRLNCRTTMILLWKIMLGETSCRVCHVSNHSNHSVSNRRKKKRCALKRSQLSVFSRAPGVFSWLKNALVAQRFSSWDALVAMIRNIHGSNVLLASDFEEYYWI